MLRLLSKRRIVQKSPSTRALAVGIVYFLLAELGHYLSFQGTGFATFWPASGLLLAALVTSPRWQWPLLLMFSAAANLTSDLVHGQPMWASLSFWTGNSLEATCGAYLMQAWMGGRARLTNFGDMLRLLLLGLLCPFISAVIGAAVVTTLHPQAAFPITLRIWWGADVLGILVATPLILSFADRRRTQRLPESKWTPQRACEAVVLGGILLTISNIIFSEPIELSSWPLRVRFPALSLPLLAWAALRFDLRGATLANAAVAMIATYYASRGSGPFVLSEQAIHHALGLQVFLAISTFMVLVLGAGVTQTRLAEQQQRRLAGLLREERKLLQSILNSIGDCVMVADTTGRWLQFNPAARRLCGIHADQVPPADLLNSLTFVSADGQTPVPFQQLPQQRALRGESTEPSQQFHLKAAGQERAITCTARPLRDVTGQLLGGVVVAHDITAQAQAAAEREVLIAELQRALGEIKTLRGLIPMCANCKSIRDDDGYWQRLEGFLMKHTEAEFTHGICNDCGVKLYGQMWQDAVIHAAHHKPQTAAT